MEWIKQLAAVFCAVCILTGAMELLHDGALKKSMNFILALILLVCVVGAVSGTRWSLDFDYNKAEASKTKTEEAISEYQAEYICRSLLNDKGIAFEKITAKANKTADGSIIISEIKIKGSDRAEEAAKEISNSGICDTVILE